MRNRNGATGAGERVNLLTNELWNRTRKIFRQPLTSVRVQTGTCWLRSLLVLVLASLSVLVAANHARAMSSQTASTTTLYEKTTQTANTSASAGTRKSATIDSRPGVARLARHQDHASLLTEFQKTKSLWAAWWSYWYAQLDHFPKPPLPKELESAQ